jgi:hypothetical protein
LIPNSETDFWRELEVAAGFEAPITPQERAALRRHAGFAKALASYLRAKASHEGGAALSEAVELALIARAPEQSGDAARWSSLDTQPPSWWEAHSRRVFAEFGGRQSAALALVGRTTPLEVAGVGAYLQSRREREAELGDRGLFVHYPTGEEHPAFSYLEVWRGYAMADYQAEFWVAHADRAAYETRRLEWLAAREQPLAKLVMMQDEIAGLTGCEEWEATRYLLCAVVPLLPWVRINKRPWPGSQAVEIVVGSPHVPPRAVAAAYAAFRGDAALRGQARLSRSEWPLRIESFVIEYRAGLGGRRFLWRDCYAAFCERYREQPYKNAMSFKAKYYARQAEARAVTKGVLDPGEKD